VIFLIIGLTKSVQPYCRLAIITMQNTPQTSWPQRPAASGSASDATAVDSAVIRFIDPAVVLQPPRNVLPNNDRFKIGSFA
jgi:hypothetical protein